jgi:ribosomal protein S18 acetylase RimI-like enzyme
LKDPGSGTGDGAHLQRGPTSSAADIFGDTRYDWKGMTRRLATADDLHAVHRIYMHETVLPFLGYDAMPVEPFRPIFEQLVAAGGFHVFEIEGGIAGFYNITRFPGRAAHVAQLGALATAPERQGQGVGKAMVLDALKMMEEAGVARVELQAEADNERGLAFYRKLGFVEESRQRAAYKRAGEPNYVDEVMMVKFLGPLA